LPNNVAIVLPSNGDRTLPATIAFLRPLWVQRKYPDLPLSTPWHDWPAELRTTYDLDTIPQDLNWSGWGTSEPLDEGAVVPAESRLGKLIQPADEEQVVSGAPPLPPLVVPPQPSLEPSTVTSAPEPSLPTPPPLLLHNSACSAPEHEPPDSPREGDPFSGLPEDS